jgi:hypothetical protein
LGDVGADRKGTLLARADNPGDGRVCDLRCGEGPLLGPIMALTDAPSGRRTSLGRAVARRLPNPDRRRALELLAGCPQEGCTEAIMLAHGFTITQMVELVRPGLAAAAPQRVKAGRERMEIAVLRITEAGRRVLAKAKPCVCPVAPSLPSGDDHPRL